MDTIRCKQKMLFLARAVLENELNHSNHDLKAFKHPGMDEKSGLFVTLSLDNQLRGCIGRIEPTKSCYQSIIDLSKAAAFEDHRFNRLTANELQNVRIEISLLSKPEKLAGDTTRDKVNQIRPQRDGVILSSGSCSATFLPQVWESLPLPEEFISHLCQKAGLPADYWEYNDLDISVYQVEHFEED